MDELVRELARLSAYAEGLGALIGDAQAQAPAVAEASDPSGAVRARVGGDGLPEWIRVAADLRSQVGPEGFGQAVGEACAAAAGERMSGWTRALAEVDWKDRVERLASEPAPRTVEPPPLPGALGSGPGAGRLRPLEELAEEMLKAFDSLAAGPAVPEQAVSGTGRAAGGQLSLTLTGTGTVSCAADPRWVSGQSADGLTGALSQALAGARQDLASAAQAGRRRGEDRAAHLDGVLSEALALLRDPGRLAGPGRGVAS